MPRYIDVDEVLEQIRKKLGIKSLDYLLEAERQIVDVIQSMPSIDVEPKRGEWIDMWDKYCFEGTFKCSVCGTPWTLIDGTPQDNGMNYCPNCGASMREREGE